MVITHRTLLIPIEVRVGCVDVEVFRAAKNSDEALEGAHDDVGCRKLDHFLNHLTYTYTEPLQSSKLQSIGDTN